MVGESLESGVLMVVYDPPIPSEGDRRLSQVFGWHQVDRLAQDFASDLSEASHGLCSYRIVDRVDLNVFPVKEDGFRYSADDYTRSWRTRRGFHHPDWANYHHILDESGAIERIRTGIVDEVWLFAFPYGGFYESRMAGPGAFWCNAPPLAGFEEIGRRFVIMGFNFERGVGEMLESFGHRAESIISRVYERLAGEADLWARFTRTDLTHPGLAEVGSIHFAPNSSREYDWGNKRKVPCRCDNWFTFPDLTGPPRLVDSSEWGGGHIRHHHLWWFRHLPHVQGKLDGVSMNWWHYIVDPNRAP